jgi:hypothetical protein
LEKTAFSVRSCSYGEITVFSGMENMALQYLISKRNSIVELKTMSSIDEFPMLEFG